MSSQLNNNQLANKQPFIEYENDKVGKIKVQQCLNKDPHLWFAILESQSQTETRGVDKPTYHTVVGSLTQQVADHVKDIIRHSPDNDKYAMTIMQTGSSSTSHTNLLKVERPYYEQEQFNNDLKYCKPDVQTPSFCNRVTNLRFSKILMQLFPVFSWLPNYNVKHDLIGDVVSGCTVAVMHIPQGMGYAMLANLPPIVGIYTAFFPVLMYFIFGTSKHNSMGTFAVVSIMVGKNVIKLAEDQAAHVTVHTLTNSSILDLKEWTVDMASDHPLYTPIQVATTCCLVIGFVQCIMYVLRLGMISSLLSETLVSGFTTGAGIHVLVSQMKDLIGVRLTPVTGNFKLIQDVYQIITKLGDANLVAVSISIMTIIIIFFNNEWLKEKLASKCSLPVPIELIAVVLGTVLSRVLFLGTKYGIRTIGHIPTGFPAFEIPNLELVKEVGVDSFIIAMVSYTISVSMALIFAQKLNYEIDFNQELLAMGAGNIVGSFFQCMPFSASLSRSAIQESSGGKTQLASLVSCGILTFVLLWIGPFFEDLPRCVLASVIVVALKGMLMQIGQFKQFWKLSRLDATVWMATFLAVIIVAIDVGLLVGIVLSLACIFIRGMKPYTCLLGHVPQTDLYLDVGRYKAAEEINFIKIFHYCGSLNFASRGSFKTELCSLIGLDLAQEIRNKNMSNLHYESIHLKCLVMDFSALSYIDPSGATSIKNLVRDFNKLSIAVYIAGASCPTYEMMKKCNLEPSYGFNYYPTVHDAVHTAMGNIGATSPISIITESSKQ